MTTAAEGGGVSRVLISAGVRALRLQSPGVLQHAAEDELDLPVQAAQVVVRPALEGVEDVAIDPQQKRFPLSHKSLIDRPCVDDRLRATLAAEHDEEVAHHRRLALVVEVHDRPL
jgi:hypothetical protein